LIEFVPGLYVRKGITFTSRGCNYNCPWCTVREREGNFREIPITEGNEIQDNNILLSSWSHWDKVIAMLKTQKAIRFVGGLDSRLLTSRHVEDLRCLRIKELFFSYDEPDRWRSLLDAAIKLQKAGFAYHKLRCYVLVKFDPKETVEDAEKRLQVCYRMGFMPFVQIYRSPDATIRGSTHLPKGEYKGSWNELREIWSRPARIKPHMKEVEGGQDNSYGYSEGLSD
jgi:MoaA/NifB/PqqE/SkfB family radical SAM enzyme